MMRLVCVFVLFFMLNRAQASEPPADPPRTLREVAIADGGVMRYALVTPDGFKEGGTYPVLLALPPGGQNEAMVEMGLGLYWEAEAKKRGWVLVSPVARDGMGLTQDVGAIESVLDAVGKVVKFEGGRAHVAGASNGGKTALRFATTKRERVASLMLLPGAPSTPEDWNRLDVLKGMNVRLYVGGEDRAWLQEAKRLETELSQLNARVTLSVLEGQGHVLKLDAAALFDELEKERTRPDPKSASKASGERRATGDDVRAVARVLDDFHDAAAKADGTRYFGHFADDAVFLGTDATERWTLPEFKAFAKPYFDKGKGWAYSPRDRRVNLTPDGSTAWFDELLDNAKLGECRGSGVLIRVGEAWKVLQYNLSIPIPNPLAERFAKTIAEEKAASKEKAAAKDEAKKKEAVDSEGRK